jgi:hypothetical protein
MHRFLFRRHVLHAIVAFFFLFLLLLPFADAAMLPSLPCPLLLPLPPSDAPSLLSLACEAMLDSFCMLRMLQWGSLLAL